jgi:putative transposase
MRGLDLGCGPDLSANQEWALDFVHDAVECGRAIRVLGVVDAYTRECLALEVDKQFAATTGRS